MSERHHLDLKLNKNAEANNKTCCGGAPTAREDACCQADEKAKNNGQSGCGCGCSNPAETT
ncbi:MAG: hypothetical protein V7776_17950 [Halopseudomonas aestusnigri]